MALFSDLFTKKLKEEYEIHYFGNTASYLASDVASMYMEAMRSGLDGLNSYVSYLKAKETKTDTASENDLKQLEQIMDQFTKEIESNVELNLQTIKEYMEKKIFHVPEHIVLPDDAVQDREWTPQQASDLDLEMSELLSRLKSLHYMETALRQELEEAGQELQDTERLTATASNIAPSIEHLPTFPGMQLEQLIEKYKTVHNGVSSITSQPEQEDEDEDKNEEWDECTPPSAEM